MKNILLIIWFALLLFCEYKLFPQPGKMIGVLFGFCAVLVLALEIRDAKEMGDNYKGTKR